jgi:hypothetical protein
MDAVTEFFEHRKSAVLSPMMDRLQTFHFINPEVLDFLVLELRAVQKIGWTRASVGSLWHHARWVLTDNFFAPGESFLMDQNFSSYYARLVAILHPDLNGFFEMKASKRADAGMGTMLEPASKKQQPGYIRRLLWADGRAIELGWRPSVPHEPKPITRRKRVSAEKTDAV